MEALLHQLQDVYTVLLWPFFRFAAALAVAPVLGEALVPVRARMLLALVLAVAVQPALPPPPQVDPVSLHGVVLVFEQVLVGGMIGLAFHLVLAALTLFGVLASSQMGLAMAMLNDPVSGTPSDAVSALVYVVFVLRVLRLRRPPAGDPRAGAQLPRVAGGRRLAGRRARCCGWRWGWAGSSPRH